MRSFVCASILPNSGNRPAFGSMQAQRQPELGESNVEHEAGGKGA
jgi:hypothetical protein